MADLITLDEIKTALDIDPTDTRKDDLIEQAIPQVTSAIRAFTERDFATDVVTEERSFSYAEDDGGFLDIDDAAAITLVKLVVPHGTDITLTTDEWVAMPARREDAPIFTYLALPGFNGAAAYSPAMGFTRNLDVYAAEGRLRGVPTTLKVTGDWGWPTVPDSVKRAAIWTVEDWVNRPSSEGLSAESIEGFSRAWGSRTTGVAQALAIPNRARDLLSQFARVTV